MREKRPKCGSLPPNAGGLATKQIRKAIGRHKLAASISRKLIEVSHPKHDECMRTTMEKKTKTKVRNVKNLITSFRLLS